MSETPAPPLPAVDWAAPWFSPWRALGQAVAARVEQGGSVAEALNAQGGSPRRFVPQSSLPEGMAYEAFIYASGAVPTRDNLHDFFNGLAWMRFPRTKLRLNALQAAQIAQAGVGAQRGVVRDALTLIDENAALLQAPDALWNALADKDWACVFGPLRPLWAQSHLVLLGHALLEKLLTPRKDLTAHVLRVQGAPALAPAGSPEALAGIDCWLADWLEPQRLSDKPFAHLPVLGVPGWWDANAEPGFYTDARVFRPRRSAVPASGGH